MSVFDAVWLVFGLRFVVVAVLSVVLGLVSVVAPAFCAGVFLQARLLLVRLRSIVVCTSSFYGYFFSSGWVFSSSSCMSLASLSSVRLPSLVMVLPLSLECSTSPAVSSCCIIFLMLEPPPFLACSLLTLPPVLPP